MNYTHSRPRSEEEESEPERLEEDEEEEDQSFANTMKQDNSRSRDQTQRMGFSSFPTLSSNSSMLLLEHLDIPTSKPDYSYRSQMAIMATFVVLTHFSNLGRSIQNTHNANPRFNTSFSSFLMPFIHSELHQLSVSTLT